MRTLVALLILNVVSLSVLAGVGKGSTQKKTKDHVVRTSESQEQKTTEVKKSSRMPASSLPVPVTLSK